MQVKGNETGNVERVHMMNQGAWTFSEDQCVAATRISCIVKQHDQICSFRKILYTMK